MSIGLDVGSYFSFNASITISRLTVVAAEVEADVPSGPLGHRWRRFSLPGWFGGVSTAYSTLAAAETVPRRGRSLNVVCSWGISGHPMSAF